MSAIGLSTFLFLANMPPNSFGVVLGVLPWLPCPVGSSGGLAVPGVELCRAAGGHGIRPNWRKARRLMLRYSRYNIFLEALRIGSWAASCCRVCLGMVWLSSVGCQCACQSLRRCLMRSATGMLRYGLCQDSSLAFKERNSPRRPFVFFLSDPLCIL